MSDAADAYDDNEKYLPSDMKAKKRLARALVKHMALTEEWAEEFVQLVSDLIDAKLYEADLVYRHD